MRGRVGWRKKGVQSGEGGSVGLWNGCFIMRDLGDVEVLGLFLRVAAHLVPNITGRQLALLVAWLQGEIDVRPEGSAGEV